MTDQTKFNSAVNRISEARAWVAYGMEIAELILRDEVAEPVEVQALEADYEEWSEVTPISAEPAQLSFFDANLQPTEHVAYTNDQPFEDWLDSLLSKHEAEWASYEEDDLNGIIPVDFTPEEDDDSTVADLFVDDAVVVATKVQRNYRQIAVIALFVVAASIMIGSYVVSLF